MAQSANGAADESQADAGAEFSESVSDGAPPAGAEAAAEEGVFAQRPELFVGAAFIGGVVAAQLLRVARR